MCVCAGMVVLQALVVLLQALVEGPGLELLDGEDAGTVGRVEVLGSPQETQPSGGLCQQLSFWGVMEVGLV